jgi:hypothetical protein
MRPPVGETDEFIVTLAPLVVKMDRPAANLTGSGIFGQVQDAAA